MARETEMNRKRVSGKAPSQSKQSKGSPSAERSKGKPSGVRRRSGETPPPGATYEVDANEVVRDYYESSDLAAEQVLEEFGDGERTGTQGNLSRKLSQNPEGPDIYAGDIDAGWDGTDVGEEAVGGSNPTPDQDIVEEIGEAAGVTYQDAEPLRIEEKLAKRDAHRWELDPASDEEYADRLREQKETDKGS